VKDCEIVLGNPATAALYEDAIGLGADASTLTKQFVGVWNQLASAGTRTIDGLGVSADAVAGLAKLVTDGTVSATAAAQIAEALSNSPDAEPADVATELGLVQVRDEGQMQRWVDEAFDANGQAIADSLKNPKKAAAAVGFLRGQVMKLSQGKADPRLAGELIEKKLEAMKD
jgi:aspartyl-tRNA(Asn)/glutamyl-tRNA(Gln) amidotransferase subunit B